MVTCAIMAKTATEWRNRGTKVVRQDASTGRPICMVLPTVEDGQHIGAWTWVVIWPGHLSPRTRQEGQAASVIEAAACADEFARTVNVQIPEPLSDTLAADLETRVARYTPSTS